VILHHNGGLTSMNAMGAGTPQVILSRFDLFNDSLQLLEDQGSGIALFRGNDTAESAVAACEKVLSDSSYSMRARLLADEIAGLPTPPELVGSLERLVSG
jgi:UDP:flavonoid glycosyltransferase YjiC (YdhE family)